ncbi:MAG TPA: hypothetical protein VK473_13355 [Terriglobales bacterium]|nr:hypothetical protein [Terriglobales bacterium]
MPILFMAVVALAVFVVMGLMLFYAAYKEAKEPHKKELDAGEGEQEEQKNTVTHVAG